MNLKKTLEPLLFFSIRVIEDLTRETATGEKETLTSQPQTKGLTLENWEVSKAIFLEQRLNTYRDSYTRAEKINKELTRIDEMLIDPTHFRTDYGVIKQRYKEYLLSNPDEITATERDLIEHWLYEFSEKMSEQHYKKLCSALKEYIETNKFPQQAETLEIKNKPNKKRFGWCINQILRDHSKNISYEVLVFAQKNINLFKRDIVSKNKYQESNLYKYFTTKTE
jgi:hypothetical protein